MKTARRLWVLRGGCLPIVTFGITSSFAACGGGGGGGGAPATAGIASCRSGAETDNSGSADFTVAVIVEVPTVVEEVTLAL